MCTLSKRVLIYLQVDLSGSRVVSDNPVAVISGGDYTADMRGSNSDAVPKGMVMDQVPPLGELGTRYSLVSLPESPVDNLVKVVFTQSDTSRLDPKLSFQTNTLKQEGTKTEHYEYLSLAAGSATMLIYDERVLVMLLFPRDHTMAGVIVTPERGWGTDYYMVMPPAGTTLVLVAMSSETNSESECEKLSFRGGTRNISVDWSQSEDQKFYFSHLELEIYSIFKNISSACRFNGYLFYQGDLCACALGWYTPKEDSYESAVDDEHDVYLTLEKVTSSYTQLPDTIFPETSTSTPNIRKQQNVKPSNISDSSTGAFQHGEFYSTPEGMTTPSNTITSDAISEGALKTSLSWLIPKKDAFESVVDGENNVYLTTDKITSTYTKLLDMILPEIFIHAPKLLTLQNVKSSNITNSSTTRLQYDQFYSTPERMTTLSNTITPDSILEQNFTTSQNDFMNLNTSFLCPCQCQVKRGWHQISQRSRSELEEALEKQLKMKQSTLSYWRRRHTSATNIHQTAKCIGATLTVAVFSVTAVFLILIDLSTLFIRGRPVVPRAQRSVASKVHGKENNVFVSAIA